MSIWRGRARYTARWRSHDEATQPGGHAIVRGRQMHNVVDAQNSTLYYIIALSLICHYIMCRIECKYYLIINI